jgi:hypothetical protein
MNPRFFMKWFCTIACILVLAGIVFAFFGLGILPVQRNVLLSWESAIYGAIMMGWGTTLFFLGRIAFRRNDAELMVIMLYGLFIWLVIEALFSAYLGVWFNVGVDIGVFLLFSIPLLSGIRYLKAKRKTMADKPEAVSKKSEG